MKMLYKRNINYECCITIIVMMYNYKKSSTIVWMVTCLHTCNYKFSIVWPDLKYG